MRGSAHVTRTTTKVSHDERIKAMILNGLGFVSSALYMYSGYFEDKPLQIIIREGALADHFNDDALHCTPWSNAGCII